IGTVPIGTGELRMIHSRVLWMLRPVERSITVSAPQRIAHTILSTSSSTDDVTAELPILALILVRKLRPMIIGSSSAWLMLEGMMARPRATSLRTNSGVMKAGTDALKLAAEILALGDIDHLLGDDAGAGEFELRDLVAVKAAQRLVMRGEGFGGMRRADIAVVLRLDGAALIFLD